MKRGCASSSGRPSTVAAVAEPTTPLPTDEAPVADERTTLLAFLDYLRVVLARKADGLTDEQARVAACPPSDLTVLGLVRHMTDVERNWFRRSLSPRTPRRSTTGTPTRRRRGR